MTEEIPRKILQEHDDAHRATLESLKETEVVLEHAQQVLSEARIKLKNATVKYEERLYGPENSEPH